MTRTIARRHSQHTRQWRLPGWDFGAWLSSTRNYHNGDKHVNLHHTCCAHSLCRSPEAVLCPDCECLLHASRKRTEETPWVWACSYCKWTSDLWNIATDSEEDLRGALEMHTLRRVFKTPFDILFSLYAMGCRRCSTIEGHTIWERHSKRMVRCTGGTAGGADCVPQR